MALWIGELKGNMTSNFILFVVGAISFMLFMISEKKTHGWLKYTGLFQRINMISLYLALILNHLELLR